VATATKQPQPTTAGETITKQVNEAEKTVKKLRSSSHNLPP
jgi:hypothetical protein